MFSASSAVIFFWFRLVGLGRRVGGAKCNPPPIIERLNLTVNYKFDDKGLIPAIVQDAQTGEVLMLGYMNQEALKLTLDGEDVWFYSRSRQEMWHKGATSGNYLRVSSVSLDCDGDAVLVKANPQGPVCHTGNRTCFFQELRPIQN